MEAADGALARSSRFHPLRDARSDLHEIKTDISTLRQVCDQLLAAFKDSPKAIEAVTQLVKDLDERLAVFTPEDLRRDQKLLRELVAAVTRCVSAIPPEAITAIGQDYLSLRSLILTGARGAKQVLDFATLPVRLPVRMAREVVGGISSFTASKGPDRPGR